MKHFMIESTYLVPFEELGDNIQAHRSFLRTGYDKGLLLCSGPQRPPKGGIIIARAATLEEIVAFMADDPYQKRGLASYRFVEFDPVKRQPFLEEWVR